MYLPMMYVLYQRMSGWMFWICNARERKWKVSDRSTSCQYSTMCGLWLLARRESKGSQSSVLERHQQTCVEPQDISLLTR